MVLTTFKTLISFRNIEKDLQFKKKNYIYIYIHENYIGSFHLYKFVSQLKNFIAFHSGKKKEFQPCEHSLNLHNATTLCLTRSLSRQGH